MEGFHTNNVNVWFFHACTNLFVYYVSTRLLLFLHEWVEFSFFFRFALVWFMVFNATFNNISVILWLSVLLVEETGVPGENR
jgi:hypothetical protein